MADIFNVSKYTDQGVGSSDTSNFSNPRYGPDLDTGDLRRKFDFGDRVSELAIAQDPFFRFVSMVAKKPTDDPQFKFTEKRGSWHKRYAYPVAFSHDDITYVVNGQLSSDIKGVMDTEGDVFYVKMAGDYKTEGNVGNVAGQTNTDFTIGASGTQPNFYIEDQLIKINIASAVSSEAADYVVAKIQQVTNVAGSSGYNTQATMEYVKLKCAVVRPGTLSGSYFVPRVADSGFSTANEFGIATEFLAGASTVQDNASNVPEVQVLEEMRSYVIGTSFGEGTGYPETWKDQPFTTSYGQTQIWKTTMAMSNTARATVLRYEPNEWQRIWKEKLIEHKWDIEQSLLFGSQYTDSSSVGHTQGAVDYILNNGNLFNWTTSKSTDDFLVDMSTYLDPRYNSSSATVYFCSTDVYNWFHKLGGYALQNLNTDGRSASVQSRYTSDLALAGRKKVLGLDTTTVNTVHGDMNLVRNIHLDGTKVKILGINMNHCKYRPLVGNGLNRDTSVYVGVQTLENSGVDRRVDQILTEAGMEWSMPECHAIWKS